MNKKVVMLIFALCVAMTYGNAGAQRRGGGGGKSPVARLITDLQQATPRAKLSDDQSDKLQSDIASLKRAIQAKQQGETVDADQLKATIDDLHGIVDSGAFQDADQKQLDQDFKPLQSQ
jgi:TolA-binding protein